MKHSPLSFVGISLFICLSCSQANHKEDAEMKEQLSRAPMEQADTTAFSANALSSSSAAVENPKDTTHQFIRTANLKFKVKNVVQATYHIEDITRRQGGFVTYTNLTSQVEDINHTKVSADSTLETTYYTVSNTLTLRVPNTQLDTTLKQIAQTIDYLDFRVIQADDIALQLLANNLSQKRASRHVERLNRVLDSGKKQRDATETVESMESREERADQALLSSLSLKEQMQFSTVQLSIYQRQTARQELIATYKNIDAYRPGLGSQLAEAAQDGWEVLVAILVFLARLWGLFLVGSIGYVVYRKVWYKIKYK